MTNGNGKLNTKQIGIGSLLIIAVFLSVVYLCYKSIKQSRVSDDWVNHTLTVLTQITSAENILVKMNSIQRGYILTSQPRFIELYKKHTEDIYERVNKIQEVTKDNSAQMNFTTELMAAISELDNIYKENIALVTSGKVDAAIDRVRSGLGQKKFEDTLSIFKSMIRSEEALLEKRLSEQKATERQSDYILIVATIVAILMILSLATLVISEFNRRTKTQAELNKSSQLQKAILDSASSAIIACDSDGKITLFNKAAEKLLGYTAKEIIGKTPAVFHDEVEIITSSKELSERFNEKIDPGFETFAARPRKNIIESDQWTYIKKDGTRIPVSLSVSPQWGENGEISGFVGLAQDISVQLEHESVLIKAREQALEGTKAKSEFLANMSHEIRTPMNAIMGMAELLEETDLDDEQKRYVDTFQRAGESLLNLINDILDLSKIEAGHFELDYVPFNISSVIEKSVEIVATKAHQKNLELIVDVDENMHEAYFGDPNRIRQILLNLLGNSVKFTKQGEILLKISQAESKDGKDGITIEVRDTGIGMSKEQLRNLFERFRQADSSITKEYGGTGLGLNITKRLVQLMDGFVDVKSESTKGTTFIIHLYLTKDDHPVETEKISLKDKRILIVDDNKTNRYIFRKILAHHDGTIDDVENGLDAIKLIHEKAMAKIPYDLILLDGKMPGLDGFQVAEKVQTSEELKGPIIMMITSDNRPGDLARARNLGLKSYLLKPILKNDLLTQIRKSLFNFTEDQKKKEVTVLKAPAPETKLKILLVDDNDENRLVIRSFVKTLPWQVDEAKNGQEAIDLQSKNNYDVILMDMQMPVMDGYTATRIIRQNEKNYKLSPAPILALTAYALKEEVDKSLEAGCNGHISKPISKAKLLSCVEEVSAELNIVIDKELEDLIPDYIANRKSEIEIFEDAFDKKDFPKIQALGHKLRGTAGSYGFDYLSEIGKEFEEKSKVSDAISIQHALNQYKLYMKRIKVSYS